MTIRLEKYNLNVTITDEEWSYLTNRIMGTSEPEPEYLEAEFTFLHLDTIKTDEEASLAVKKYINDCREAAEGVSIEEFRAFARKFQKQ